MACITRSMRFLSKLGCDNRDGMDSHGHDKIVFNLAPCSIPSKFFNESERSVRVRSAPSRIAHPPTPAAFPHAHRIPSSCPQKDPHGSSGMRTWLLLHGRCPYPLPRRDCQLFRGPHLPFLFRALPSQLFLRGICPSRREVWGAPMVLPGRIQLPIGGRPWELQYRRAA